jgi:predicted membrane metal-binding protein
LFKVGFQLSYAACLGLGLLTRQIKLGCNFLVEKGEEWLAGKRKAALLAHRAKKADSPPSIPDRIRRAIIDFTAASFAAQIFTAPILLSAFGYLSGWGLFLNFIFVPLIGIAFSWLLVFVALACCLPVAASAVILFLPNAVLSLALLVFETVDFSAFAISGIPQSVGSVVCYYLGCTFLSDKWNLRKKWRYLAAGCLFTASFVCVVSMILCS